MNQFHRHRAFANARGYSFGGAMTIFRINKPGAEETVLKLATGRKAGALKRPGFSGGSYL